jgi:type IV pilus assembly protein PilM
MPKSGGATKAAPKPKAVTRSRPSGGSFVGLDIGTQTIKVVEVSGSGSGLKVTALGIANTPPGSVQQGVIVDPKALGAAIKTLLSKSGVRTRKSISAASGAAAVVVRVIDVPKMTTAELAETMKWEVERHIPFAVNDVEMSFTKIEDPVVDSDPNNPNMEVLLAVAQRDMVAAHLETLKQAGLTAVAIDVEPLAVGRALLDLSRDGKSQRNVVLVNIGASMTDVGIFKQGVLRFPRTIPLGGDNLTQAIADRLGLSMDAAEDEKRESASIIMDLIGQAVDDSDIFGDTNADTGVGRSPFDVDLAAPLPPPMPGIGDTVANPFAEPIEPTTSFDTEETPVPQVVAAPAPVEPDDPRLVRRKDVFNAIFPVLSEFAMELQNSINYFRSKYPSDTVDQIVLCGGSARIENLDQYLQSQLGIATEVADPFAGVNVVARQLSVEHRNQVAPALAVAMGLAVRDAVLGAE